MYLPSDADTPLLACFWLVLGPEKEKNTKMRSVYMFVNFCPLHRLGVFPFFLSPRRFKQQPDSPGLAVVWTHPDKIRPPLFGLLCG